MTGMRSCVFLVALGLVPLACGPSQPASPAPSDSAAPAGTAPAEAAAAPAAQAPAVPSETLVAQWRELAKTASGDTLPVEEGIAITTQLQAQDPAALVKVLDLLGEPTATPIQKIFVVASLRPALDAALKDRLLELSKPGQDITTRACAIELLTYIQTPDVHAALKEYVQEEDRQVRFVAMKGIAFCEPNEGRAALRELWNAPETSIAERNEIVRVLAGGPAMDSLPTLVEALEDERLEPGVRQIAAMTLGRFGDNESYLAPLKARAEQDADPGVRQMAEQAAAALEEKLKNPKDKEGEQKFTVQFNE